MEFTVEESNVSISVMGLDKNKKGKDVRRPYYIDNEAMGMLFDQLNENYVDFENSVRDVDEKIAKRYQAVGLENIEVESIGENDYVYRLTLRYIFRDQNKIWITKKKNYKSRPIKFNGEEYQSIVVCASFYLNDCRLIIDRRGTLGPMREFFRKTFDEYLTPADFGLASHDDLEKQIRVHIVQELVDDFEDKIKENFEKIGKVLFSYTKPRKTRKANEKVKKSSAPQLFQKAIEKIWGTTAALKTFENLPVKTLSISMTLDTSITESEMKKFNAIAKNKILSEAKEEYLSGLSVKFQKSDADEELERAVFRGVAKTDTRDVTYDPYDDSSEFFAWHDELY